MGKKEESQPPSLFDNLDMFAPGKVEEVEEVKKVEDVEKNGEAVSRPLQKRISRLLRKAVRRPLPRFRSRLRRRRRRA